MEFSPQCNLQRLLYLQVVLFSLEVLQFPNKIKVQRLKEMFICRNLCKVDYVILYLWPCWSILALISWFSLFALNVTKRTIYTHISVFSWFRRYDRKKDKNKTNELKQKRKTFEPWFPLFPDGPRGPTFPWKYDIKCMLHLLFFFSSGKLSNAFKHTIKRFNWPWDPYYQRGQRHQANLSAPVKANKGAIKTNKPTIASKSINISTINNYSSGTFSPEHRFAQLNQMCQENLLFPKTMNKHA